MILQRILSRSAGYLLTLVFGFNVYIGLYDSTLNKLSPLHHSLNWGIAVVSLVAAIVLILRPSNEVWISLSGIAWPFVYIFSLLVDVETLLCLGASSGCWPTVRDAYDYLILGSRVEGWVLWPYTMRVIISILIIAIFLSASSLVLKRKTSRAKYVKPM